MLFMGMSPSFCWNSARLKAYTAGFLATVSTVTVGTLSMLPLWAQSTSSETSPSAFCQLIEQSEPSLGSDREPTSDDDLLAAIAQGSLDQPCNYYGFSWQPLNFLIASQSLESQTPIIQAAIAQGADVNGQDSNGNTPLHYAQFEEVAQLLIDNGANVNVQNSQGDTPLHNLYGDKSRQLMQMLLDQGADVNALNQEQLTPLHRATPETVELLLAHGADVNARTHQNWTPLHSAVRVPAMDNTVVDSGVPNVSRVVNRLNREVARQLLAAGADLTLQDEQGRTVLHHLASESDSLWGAEGMSLFLSYGVSDALLSVCDNNGETALDIARRLGKTEIVNLLQAAAADAESGQVDLPTD